MRSVVQGVKKGLLAGIIFMVMVLIHLELWWRGRRPGKALPQLLDVPTPPLAQALFGRIAWNENDVPGLILDFTYTQRGWRFMGIALTNGNLWSSAHPRMMPLKATQAMLRYKT